MRYVLPALVPLGILAAVGFDQLAGLVGRRFARAPAALAGALVAYLLLTCLRIHPYYIDYYAETLGGPGHVQARQLFEVGWWGEGIASAVEHVNAHAAPGARLFKLLQPTHVNWFRDDLFRAEVQAPQAAEWIVVNDAGIYASDVQPRRYPS